MTILSSITGNIVEIGPGRPELSHTDFEEISLEEYVAGIEVYYNIVKLLALRGVEVG
jgi:acetylornithine deacetylase/succinyl-diaminopimelate desuccinylase-like protein